MLAQQSQQIGLSKVIGTRLEDIHQQIDGLDTKVDTLRVNKKHEKIRKWLSPPDPSSNYNKAAKLRHGSSGSWLLETEPYSNWLLTCEHILWLHGIPGCGKTILSSRVIQDLEGRCQARPGSTLLYFYFDFNDVEKQRHDTLIRSLVIQLASKVSELPPALESLYSLCLNGTRQPECSALLSVLGRLIEGSEDVYLILDALDECLDRADVLFTLNEFVDRKDLNLHILVTSRREKDIEDLLGPLCGEAGIICIQSASVNGDILDYIQARLQTDRDLKKWQKRPGIPQEIESVLMKGANGM